MSSVRKLKRTKMRNEVIGTRKHKKVSVKDGKGCIKIKDVKLANPIEVKRGSKVMSTKFRLEARDRKFEAFNEQRKEKGLKPFKFDKFRYQSILGG